MVCNIKYLFKNKITVFVSLSLLVFLSCTNDLSKTGTAITDILITSPGDAFSINKGDTRKIVAHVLPEAASDTGLSFSSSAEEIASVDAEGLISAHDTGSAGITIRAANGVQKTINVTVTAAPVHVTSIEFEEEPANPIEPVIGDNYELKLKVLPDDAANKELRITSSDDSIAWPNGDGNRRIKAIKAGRATITVTSVGNPSVSKEVEFIIKNPPAISIETLTVLYGSNEDDVTFAVKTVNGKLSYTPEVVGGGKEWVNFVSKDDTNPAQDTVRLHLKKNKTLWYRTAYIKFKGGDGKYIKGSDNKELQVRLSQKRNDNPVVTIKWVHGITGPLASEKQPIQIAGSNPGDNHNIDYVFTWNETAHTTFFNTRKVDHTHAPNEGFPDGNQCWAKTDANMLHWWFVQNKDNIDQYKKKKAADAVVKGYVFDSAPYEPFYTRGLADDREHEKSFIANLFRKTCINKGGDPANGLNWYLFGLNFGNAKKASHPPALFKDVFNKDNTPVARVTIRTKKEFEGVLKDALNSKKAVGLNRYGAQDNTQHAITLWGAAFDEDDNIIAVYVVDNNDVPNRVFPYGIRYQDGVDIYAEPESDQNNPLRYNPYFFNYSSNSPGKNHCIGEIITLDKGEAQWAEWLVAHR